MGNFRQIWSHCLRLKSSSLGHRKYFFGHIFSTFFVRPLVGLFWVLVRGETMPRGSKRKEHFGDTELRLRMLEIIFRILRGIIVAQLAEGLLPTSEDIGSNPVIGKCCFQLFSVTCTETKIPIKKRIMVGMAHFCIGNKTQSTIWRPVSYMPCLRLRWFWVTKSPLYLIYFRAPRVWCVQKYIIF